MAEKPIIGGLTPIAEIMIQQYERYLPTAFDESLTLLQKMNAIIEHLNKIGEITNDLVEQWNTVMEWVMNDGLEGAVNDKLQEWLDSGVITDLINQVIFGQIQEDLSQTVKYPIASFEIAAEVVRKDRPYFHVERYGAKGDYNFTAQTGTDDTLAFQRAFDTAIRAEGGKVLVGKKHYRLVSTVYINPTSGNFPITLEGEVSGVYRGSMLWKETAGDFFKVNLKSDGASFMDVATQFYFFKVEDISLISETKTAGSGFNMFRTRTRMNNVSFYGLNKAIEQAAVDKNGAVNYCDMSDYKNITINYPRTLGLELNKADGSTIENIYVHYPEASATSYILFRNGGGITIRNCVFAWHMTNNGVGYNNSNAYIKTTGVDGITIHDIYIERTHMSNAIYINDTKNSKVYNIYERFAGNNMFYISNSHTLSIDGVYRHAALTPNYYDVYFAGTSTGISIKNYRIRDYTTNLKDRDMKFSGTIPENIEGDIVRVNVWYDEDTANSGANKRWRATDYMFSNDLDGYLGVPQWTNNDGVQFPATSIAAKAKLITVEKKYIDASTLAYEPMVNVPSTRRVAFFDQAGKRFEVAPLATPPTDLNKKLAVVYVFSMPIAV